MFGNFGILIQKFAVLIFVLTIMAFLTVLVIEVSDNTVWDFGSFGSVVLIESIILVGGSLISVLLYGFGEIVFCINEIRDILDS